MDYDVIKAKRRIWGKNKDRGPQEIGLGLLHTLQGVRSKGVSNADRGPQKVLAVAVLMVFSLLWFGQKVIVCETLVYECRDRLELNAPCGPCWAICSSYRIPRGPKGGAGCADGGKRTVGPRRKTVMTIPYLLLKGWTVGPRPRSSDLLH
ncbi:hypothetical protein J6590_074189 [Homalodisca vitripennis]|nr:hypothetical protein J6590_074189 [Homalodisca vitripennis]